MPILRAIYQILINFRRLKHRLSGQNLLFGNKFTLKSFRTAELASVLSG